MSINLTHEIAEVELILKHLARGAYEEVAGIVDSIRVQAIPQVQAQQALAQAEAEAAQHDVEENVLPADALETAAPVVTDYVTTEQPAPTV